MIKQIIPQFLLIILASFITNALAQKHTIIVYKYNQDSIKEDAYYRPLCKILGTNSFGESSFYLGKLISFNKKKGYSETIYDYSVMDTSCTIIGDGLFGHETFVIPGDTMFVNINITVGQENNIHYVPWNHKFIYEGKNKYVYSLFDTLAYVEGELRTNLMSYNSTVKLDTFCLRAKSQYIKQISFLDQYCKRYNVEIKFKELAKAEIYAAYINNLLSPLNRYDSLTINNYSKLFRETLLNSKFNDKSLYFKTSIYNNTAYPFSALILPFRKSNKTKKDIDLRSIYQTIKLNYTDSIRNHLLTVHLTFFLRNPNLIYPSFDSLLSDFKIICKNQLYVHLLDSLNVARKILGVKKYTLKEAMSSQIIDTQDQQLNVKQLFRPHPLLIICWASWCGPCIREIPEESKLQNLYGDKVDFIYLSFDKSEKLWKDKLKTLSIKEGNNYLLKNYFISDFAHFYNIVSIPFYILYDRNGNKVEIKDLRPSQEGFRDVLEKLIR